MTTKLDDGVTDNAVGRRRRRKVRGRAVLRQRSLTPDATSMKKPTETQVDASKTSAEILPRKSQVKSKQQVGEKVQNTVGLVDDGWGGLVEETVLKYRVKNIDKNVEESTVKVNKDEETNVGHDSNQIRDGVYDLSEMGKAGEDDVQAVRKRTVVEDRLEKLKLQERLHAEQGSDSHREGNGRRRSVTNLRRRGRGRIVCLDWQKDRCTYGSSCKFLHDEDAGYDNTHRERRAADGSPRARGICFDWQNGRCRRGSSCRFAHSGAKRERGPDICFDFTRGRCHRGDTCKFAHITGREACFDFKNGRCFRGESCRFSHDSVEEAFVERRRPRGVCFDWQRGVCHRGYSCRFDHEEGSSPNTGFETGIRRRSNAEIWSEEDYEFDHTGDSNGASGEADYDNVAKEGHSNIASRFLKKKIILERKLPGVDNYYSKGVGNNN